MPIILLRLFLTNIAVALCLCGNVYAGSQEDELITILNQTRLDKGRKSLIVSPALTAAAKHHAQDMAQHNYFSHTGKNGSTIGKRIKRQGYNFCYAAENIAWGQKNAAQAMSSWQKSSGHRKNNLSRKPTEVGAGYAKGNLWVLVFGTRC